MSAFVATIHVRPKAEIRDPQGEAVAAALRSLGVAVDDVRIGKEIVVRFSADDAAAARADADKMGDELLANPVIEDFTVDVSEAGGA
jgi:phosphoribosylformylglycinamidine synthase